MASYQSERERFIAAVTREGLSLVAAQALLRCATTINRLAELACSSETADRDRIKCPATRGGVCLCDDYPSGTHAAGQHGTIPRITLQDWQAEQRAIKAVQSAPRISADPKVLHPWRTHECTNGHTWRARVVLAPSTPRISGEAPAHCPTCRERATSSAPWTLENGTAYPFDGIGWTVLMSGDPRGYTLRVVPPSYAERNTGRDRFNWDAIGVPSGPSGLRF